MDEREKAELEAIASLVEHPGWAVLMRQTQEKLDLFRAGAPFNMKDEAALNFAKGVVANCLELLATADKVAAIYQSFANPDDAVIEGETG
jgi:hypothetical protein